jgi:hypothetical protein
VLLIPLYFIIQLCTLSLLLRALHKTQHRSLMRVTLMLRAQRGLMLDVLSKDGMLIMLLAGAILVVEVLT